MNISIFASIGCQNLGDELILKNEIELLKQEFMQPHLSGKERIERVNFKVASYDAKNPLFQIENTQYFEYFPLGIKQVKNIFRNTKNFFKFLSVILWSDRVVIGGGGIIYDSELQSVRNPLDQWVFRTKVARLFRKKIYFYALGIDIKNLENRAKLKKIFENAWKITVRDEKSYEQLKALGIMSDIVDDPVMSENPLQGIGQTKKTPLSWRGAGGEERSTILGTHSSKNLQILDFEKYDFRGKKVGLALRSGYIGKSGNTKIEQLLIEEICEFVESRGGKIIFLPHSFHKTDIRANDYEFLKQFLNNEREIYADMGEVYTAYNHQMLDVVISMRLHSIILSYVYGIDQIVLSYSQKTDEVIKKLKK